MTQAIAKGHNIPTDVISIDLEDAVAPEMKVRLIVCGESIS